MHWLSRPFSMDSQVLSKKSWDNENPTKDLWLNIEKTYQGKKEDTKDNSINNNEGKESPKSFDCNNSKCDEVECFSTSE
jgi:hypothetical protein